MRTPAPLRACERSWSLASGSTSACMTRPWASLFIYHWHLTLWVSCDELPDLLVLTLAQAELGCFDRLVHLAGMTRAGNRSSDPRLGEWPGQGHNTACDIVSLPAHGDPACTSH